MNRDRWLLFISVVLFAGMGIYYLRPGWLIQFAKKTPSTAGKNQPSQAAPKVTTGARAPEVVETKIPGEIVDEDTPWGRNPFLTEAEANKEKNPGTDGLRVKAVIVGRPKSVATIDGKTVGVGEKIGEETVVEIRKDSVVLEMDGAKRILKVSEPSISIEVKEGKR